MRRIMVVPLLVALLLGVAACERESRRMTLPSIPSVRPALPAPGDVDLRLRIRGDDVPVELSRLLERLPVRGGRIGIAGPSLSWDGPDGSGSSAAAVAGMFGMSDGSIDCTFTIAGGGGFKKSWFSTAFMERTVVGVIHGTGKAGTISGTIEATDTIRADPGAGIEPSGVTRRAWRFTAETMAPDQSALP